MSKIQAFIMLMILGICLRAQAVPSMLISPTELSLQYATQDSNESLPISSDEKPYAVMSVSGGGSAGNATSNLTGNRLNLTVNNDMKAYKLSVIQTIPFANEDIKLLLNLPDQSLTLPGSQTTNGSSGGTDTNLRGYLVQISPLEIGMLETPFYQDTAPSFGISQLAFTVDVTLPQDIKPGTYSSGIKFILYQDNLPVSSVEASVVINTEAFFTMQVYFTNSNTKSLDFGVISKDIKRVDKKLKIKINTNMGKPFNLYQKRGDYMKSNQSQIEFDKRGIFFEVDNAEIKGKAIHQVADPILPDDDLIYQSSGQGESDLIPVIYSLQANSSLKAGTYLTTLSFYVEFLDHDASFPNMSATFDMKVDIQKIFTFSCFPEKGFTCLDFTRGTMQDRSLERLLRVEVFSNTGKPYRFSQCLMNPLVNDKGGRFNDDQITFVRCADNGTPLDGQDYRPLGASEQPLFKSNEKGDSEIFYVKYRLAYDHSQMGGMYRTNLNFSLNDD